MAADLLDPPNATQNYIQSWKTVADRVLIAVLTPDKLGTALSSIMGWKGQYVIVTTLAAAIALHLLSNASLSSSGDGTWAGIFGISAPTGDTAAMAGLVSQRSVLLSEIGQLRHVVSQLEQVKNRDVALELFGVLFDSTFVCSSRWTWQPTLKKALLYRLHLGLA